MFDTKIDTSQMKMASEPEIDPANVASFGQVFFAEWDNVWKTRLITSEAFRERETYANHIKKVKDLTGVEVDNPAHHVNSYLFKKLDTHTEQRFRAAFDEYKQERGTASEQRFYNETFLRNDFVYQLEQIAKVHPDLWEQIAPMRDFRSAARGMSLESHTANEKAWKHSTQGVDAYAAVTAGMLVGNITDPLNASLMLVALTGGARIGYVARRATRHRRLNTLGQSARLAIAVGFSWALVLLVAIYGFNWLGSYWNQREWTRFLIVLLAPPIATPVVVAIWSWALSKQSK